MCKSMEAEAVSSSWVDLLSDGSHTPLASMSKRKGTVRVTESTPGQVSGGKGGGGLLHSMTAWWP